MEDAAGYSISVDICAGSLIWSAIASGVWAGARWPSGRRHSRLASGTVAEVLIIAHNLDKGTDNSTVTGADGIFTFTNLEPGQYGVAAAKNGFRKSSMRVEVLASRTARVDLTLQAAAVQTAEIPQPIMKELEAMKERIEQLEAQLRDKNAQGSARAAGAGARIGAPGHDCERG